MSAPLTPVPDDLVRAYRIGSAAGAGRCSGDAVLAGPAGITVLGRATAADGVERMVRVSLSGAGETLTVRAYPPDLGTARAAAEAPDGSVVVAGETRRGPLDYRGCLLRLDLDGEVLHSAVHGPPGASGFTAVSVLPDGTTVAGGAARGRGWLVRFRAGTEPGRQVPVDDTAEVTGIAPFHGGLVLTALRERSTTAMTTARVASLADDGRTRWQRDLPATGRGELAAVAGLPAGGLVLAGNHEPASRDAAGPPNAARLWLLNLDAAGELRWERSIGVDQEQWRGRAVAALPDGSLVAAGDVGVDGRRELRVVRLRPDGSPLWSRGHGAEYDVADDLAITGDGDVVVVGTAASPERSRTDIRVLCLGQDGDLRWERRYGAADQPQ